MPKKNIPQQLAPLLILIFSAIALLFLARYFLIPESFGKYGFYRANSVTEIANLPLSYAGRDACADCHDNIFNLLRESNHKGLSCEICHGPASQHVEAPDEFLPSIQRDRSLCLQCHKYDPSRPSGFPQILSDMHNPGKACIQCHQSHNPTLPHPPEDCSACHREIANAKSVSLHITVPCINCHAVPPDHWKNPRLVKALRPASQGVCGGCHSMDANNNEVESRVDMNKHGRPYLCWDCHYQHSPEVNR